MSELRARIHCAQSHSRMRCNQPTHTFNPLVNAISFHSKPYHTFLSAFYIIFVKIYCGHLLKLKLLSPLAFLANFPAINEIFGHKVFTQLLTHAYFLVIFSAFVSIHFRVKSIIWTYWAGASVQLFWVEKDSNNRIKFDNEDFRIHDNVYKIQKIAYFMRRTPSIIIV